MIDQALACVVNDLNVQLRDAMGTAEERVILSNLIGLDGAPPPASENKIVVALIGIGEQRDLAGASGFGRGTIMPARSAVGLDLHIVIAAVFSSAFYREGLKALSEVFTHLQNKPVFNAQNTPQMPAAIQEMSLSIEPLSYAEMNQIWSALRTPYQPSIHCLLRIR